MPTFFCLFFRERKYDLCLSATAESYYFTINGMFYVCLSVYLEKPRECRKYLSCEAYKTISSFSFLTVFTWPYMHIYIRRPIDSYSSPPFGVCVSLLSKYNCFAFSGHFVYKAAYLITDACKVGKKEKDDYIISRLIRSKEKSTKNKLQINNKNNNNNNKIGIHSIIYLHFRTANWEKMVRSGQTT